MAEFTTDEINKLLRDVHQGKTHLYNLPKVVYNRVAEELTTTVYEAFNLDGDFETPRQLKRNLYVFSGAKTFNEIQDMQKHLFNEKGFKKSFSEFEKEARLIFDTYNKSYLEAEFETATRQAESAADWDRFEREKDIFPLLRYKTLQDGSVREEHASLNNIVRKVTDPFWDQFTPPNGWRCRCFTEQLEEGEEQETRITKQGGKTYRKTRSGYDQEVTQPTKLFNFNPAKEGQIFRDDAQGKGLAHPYFKVDKRWDVHKRNNFGLPLPPDVKDFSQLGTVGKQKVKAPIAKPTVLKTTPIEAPKKVQPKFKPKNIEGVVGKGAEMPNSFWNLLKYPTELKKTTGKQGSAHSPRRDLKGNYISGSVRLNMTRYNTDRLKKRIMAHEFGHAIHWQQNILQRGLGGKIVNKDFEELFTKWEKLAGKNIRGAKRLEIEKEIINKTSWQSYSNVNKKLDIKDGKESREMWGDFLDVIGSLTSGKHGWGHSKKYYKSNGGYGARAEFFAHAMENYIDGNPYMKELMPKLYEETIDFVKEVIKANEL